jgi:hypothetical protein
MTEYGKDRSGLRLATGGATVRGRDYRRPRPRDCMNHRTLSSTVPPDISMPPG